MKRMNRFVYGICVLIIGIGLSGCTVIFQKGRRSDLEKIDKLSSQLDELASARNLLAERLKQEIADKDVRLDMAEKGLVITFVADILFDSGKAKLRSEAIPTLEKVAVVLKDNLNDFNIGIEGHTDTQPIKHSGWESNWELSSARALSVLYYLEEKNIAGRRLSADAYGEFHPVASNDSKEGMKMNRRVEIVVLPKVAKVRKQEESAPAAIEEEPVTKGPKSYFK